MPPVSPFHREILHHHCQADRALFALALCTADFLTQPFLGPVRAILAHKVDVCK